MLTIPLTRLFSLPINAGLICAVLSTTLSSSAAAAESDSAIIADEVKVTDKARKLFEAGVDFIQDPDGARYGEAYRSFRAAYAESPSWKILGNLGIAAMKIERDGEAIEALETYLKHGRDEFEADEIKQVERDLRTLRASVTWIVIDVNVPGAEVRDVRRPLSGDPISNLYQVEGTSLRIGVHNGSHSLTISKKDHEAQTWSFAAAGDEQSHSFTLTEAKGEDLAPVADTTTTKEIRPVPVLTWVTVGTTIAFSAGAAVTGALALNKQAAYKDENDGTDPDAAEDLRKSGKTLNMTTDILIGAAVVSAGIATVSYFIRPTVTVEDDTAFRVVPAALRGGGALLVSGQF